MDKKSLRVHLLDALRGVAVLSMVAYHIAFDVDFFGMKDVALESFPWTLLAKVAQVLFITLGGVTFALSFARGLERGYKHAALRRIRHAVGLAVLALTITIITHLLFSEQGVKFGILHFFALASLLTIPLIRLGKWNALLGVLILIIGNGISFPAGSWWLLPVGLYEPVFPSLDYFPLFPWYGLFLLGVGIGQGTWITQWTRERSSSLRMLPLEIIGRHSLVIYLVHQPVLAGVILAVR